VTSLELVSAILVSLPKVIAAIVSVITFAFGSILLTYYLSTITVVVII
jgi:hypothetical protein